MRSSLPAHLERVLLRLSSARASGSLGDAFDGLIDRVSAELDNARAKAGVRGAARQQLIERLAAIDADMLNAARASIGESAVAALDREAREELSAFTSAMPPDAYARAHDAAMDRLVRERFGLPVIRLG